MPKITSVAELWQLKEEALQKIAARVLGENIDHLVQIQVGMENSGILAGAKEIYHLLWDLALNKKVVVIQTSRIEAFKEPVIKIISPERKETVIFEGVTPEKAREIFSEYVEKGNALDGMIQAKYE